MEMTIQSLAGRSYDLIVFSPHLDDAVLSCGGRIRAAVEAGASVLVVTAFSGGFRRQRENAGALSAFADMTLRREEDRAAMDTLGCDRLWLGHEEAIERSRRYRTLPGMVSRVLCDDRPLLESLRRQIAAISTAGPEARLLFPLGVGNHVDHQILFTLSLSFSGSPGRRNGLREPARPWDRARVRYYEEQPYVFIPFLLEHRLRALRAHVPAAARPPDLELGRRATDLARRCSSAIMEVPIIRTEILPSQRPLLRALVLAVVLWSRLGSGRLHAVQGPWTHSLVPEHVDITDQMPVKLRAAASYRSQIPALFGDPEAYQRAALAFSARIGEKPGRFRERFWTAAPRSAG